MSPVPVLRLRGVSKTFGGVHALRGVDFDLRAGEIHALLGENGAGKSTLINVVAGAHAADAGTVELDGRPVAGLTPAAARRLGVAVIHQQPALFADLSVAENIGLRGEPAGGWRRVRWGERRRRARALLARVGAGIDPDATVRSLAMPQQQLVEIAAALGSDARVLVLDEPTASLGGQDAEHLFGVIADLRAAGVGIVYVSHRLDEVARLADRVTVLRDGAHVTTRDAAGLTSAEMIRLMVGRPPEAYHKADVPIGNLALEVRGLSCRAGGVHGIDLTVRQGEILGLAGLVGAGRTELARALFGLTPADAGQVIVQGVPVTIRRPADAVAAGLAYLPEDRRRHGVILDLGVDANTTLASLGRVSRGTLIDFAAERSVAEAYVQRLGTKTAGVAAAVGTLSGGNQQKVALARWLATRPAVIILDEPTQGVDVGAKAEIHKLIGELAGGGLAVVLISSELPEVLAVSDRVAVMRGGTIVGTLGRADATPERVLRLALSGAA